MIIFQESKEARKEKKLQLTNGSLPIHLESPSQGTTGVKKFGTAAKIVAKLSPKSIQRKQDKTAKLKVRI